MESETIGYEECVGLKEECPKTYGSKVTLMKSIRKRLSFRKGTKNIEISQVRSAIRWVPVYEDEEQGLALVSQKKAPEPGLASG